MFTLKRFGHPKKCEECRLQAAFDNKLCWLCDINHKRYLSKTQFIPPKAPEQKESQQVETETEVDQEPEEENA